MAPTLVQRRRFERDLRAAERAGVTLVREPGYRKRGRAGAYKPRGPMIHHDATARGPSPGVISLLINGRADLPGPLYPFWIARNGDVHVIAAGRCNHAGTGEGFGRWLRRDMGNAHSLAICLDLTTGEKMTKAQRRALTRLTAALLARRGRKANRMCGHGEYSSRKSDPAISMPAQRKRTNRRIRRLTRRHPWFVRRWRKVRRRRGQAV